MRSSFLGLEVQKRSIQVAQKALDITGNNMSNMKTPGYTRQRVDVTSLSISSFTYWQTRLSRLSLAGQGVMAVGVSQIRNTYLDKRYRDMIPQAAEHDVKLKLMTELENTLDNIDNFGLLTAMDQLKSIFEQVALTTADAREMASQIRNQVSNICAMLRTYHADLTRLLENNLVEIENSIGATNDLIDKIVAYNAAITGEYITDAGRIVKGQGVSEYGPLELLDARNLLLDELAGYAEIEVFQNNNGSVRVTMAGVTIIDDQFSEKLVLLPFDDYNAAFISFSNGVDFQPRTGEIKAYMDMLNGNGPYAAGIWQNGEYGIPYYLHALDVFAEGFAALLNEVNKGDIEDVDQYSRTLLWSGYEIDHTGNIRLDANGNAIRARVGAANIRLSDEWLDDVLMIGETWQHVSIGEFDNTRAYSIGQTFTVGGVFHRVTAPIPVGGAFTGNTETLNTFSGTANNFAASAAYRIGDVFFDPRSGVYYRVDHAIATIPAHSLDTLMGMTIPTGSPNAGAPILTAIGVNHGQWVSPNLDGTNLSRFVRAMEADRAWGRGMDFHGNSFGYLQFLSDRLATGISFVASEFDKTMDVVNTLLDNRDGISAVSDYEEGINMLTYQKWYNASARLMTTMDEALDTLINRMGRVGL